MKIHPSSSSSSSTVTTAETTAPPPPQHRRRCIGLDLLVKAVYHVAGSVVGVPYIQRRVIRRRKPAIRFDKLLLNKDDCVVDDDDDDDHLRIQEQGNDIDIDCDCHENGELIVVEEVVVKQRRRSKVVPLKYQDSILQSLKPKIRGRRRRRRRSIK